MGEQKESRIKKKGREYWQEQVRQLDKSGLTIAAYSRETGIKSERLYKWRRRLRKERKQEIKGFVELPSSIYSSAHIVESYDIYLLPSPHIRIGGYFNPETLKHLIELLRGL